MQTIGSLFAPAGRGIVGFFVGSLVGLLIQVFWFSPSRTLEPEEKWILFIGPGIGGAFFSVIAGIFGGRELGGWFKTISVSVAVGFAAGGIVGRFGYPAVMVAIEGFDPVFHQKIDAIYANIGVMFGIPIGAVLGLIVGSSICLWKRSFALGQNMHSE